MTLFFSKHQLLFPLYFHHIRSRGEWHHHIWGKLSFWLTFRYIKLSFIQVNLCQKLFFLQKMGRTCCVQKLFWMSETISVHNVFSPGLSLEFSCIKLVIKWAICRHIVLIQKLELLTVNPEDLEEAEESEAVAKLVDRNHVNRASQISSSGSSSKGSSTIIMDNYGAGTLRTGRTGTDLTDLFLMIAINQFGNSLGFYSFLQIFWISGSCKKIF